MLSKDMPPEDRLFIEVWNRLTSDWSRLTTFRQMGVLGEDAAREAIHQNHTYFVQQQLLHGEFQHLLKNRASFVSSGMAEAMPREMTETSVRNFRYTLHAATLVFAHSILDAAVFDCLRICAAAGPDDWRPHLGAKKVALSEVASKPYSELLCDAISAELSRLEHESLMAKVDKTFQLCKPDRKEFLTNGFRFDRDRLSKLDDLRHRIVHDPGTNASFDTIYEDLQFMQSSGLHLFSMVGDRFDLRFSGLEAAQAMAARQHDPGES